MKRKPEVPLDDIKFTTTMNWEQLEQYTWRLWQEMEKQRYEKDLFQLEKEKIRSFLHITKLNLMDIYSALRNKDRELCELLRKQEAELIQCRAEVNSAHTEQEFNIIEIKGGQIQQFRKSSKEQQAQLSELRMDLEDLRRQMKLGNFCFKEDIKRENLEYSKQMRQLLEDLENKAECLEKKFDVLLESDRMAMRSQLAAKQSETEGRKDKQLLLQRELLDNVRVDLAQYYNTVTVNNLTLVNSLKNEMESINTDYGRAKKLFREAEHKNLNMKKSLETTVAEIAVLKLNLANEGNITKSTMRSKNDLAEVMAEKETLTFEREVLDIRCQKLAQETRFLRESLLKEALSVQQREGVRYAMLQKKLTTATQLLENNELQEHSILLACASTPQTKSDARGKLEMCLLNSNKVVKDLKRQLSSALQAHNILVKTFQIKMERYGMQEADLGFKTRELYKSV